MRNALKAVGAALAVVALCAPLMFLPGEEPQSALGDAGVVLTVPPTVVVATTIPGLETTTTTTEAPPPTSVPTEPTLSTTTTTSPIDITIAAAGNVVVPESLLRSVRDADTGSYDFTPVLAPITPYLAKADYAVAALEPRLAGSQAAYGLSQTPNAPRELAFALKQAGVDLVATANPHSLDLGWDGVAGTLDRLDSAGLRHVGTARSKAERDTPVIADIRGIRVAFLNYTASILEALPTGEEKPFAVNTLELATVTQDALTARSWGADAVVAMLNYGTVGAEVPSAAQVELSEQILRSGVDAILGCRARVVQPIGHIFTYASWRANDKYVAYCLGDFLSDGGTIGRAVGEAAETAGDTGVDSTTTTIARAAEELASGGLIAYLHLEKRGLRTYVTGVSYLPLYQQVVSMAQTPAGGTASSETTGASVSPASTSTTLVTEQKITRYRILPVLPGLEPDTDIPLTMVDRQRMAQIWEDLRSLLYRPDEKISPLDPDVLGL